MEYILSWLDKESNTYKNKIIEADTEKKAINRATKHCESLKSGSWDEPFLCESDECQIMF